MISRQLKNGKVFRLKRSGARSPITRLSSKLNTHLSRTSEHTVQELVELGLVKRDINYITELDNPAEKTLIYVVTFNPEMIEKIENPSENVQITAVSADGIMIKYLYSKCKVVSTTVQLAAVKSDPFAIYYISQHETPSLEVQLEAVQKDGAVIEFIKEPCVAVQRAAIKENPSAIQFIKNLSDDLAISRKLPPQTECSIMMCPIEAGMKYVVCNFTSEHVFCFEMINRLTEFKCPFCVTRDIDPVIYVNRG